MSDGAKALVTKMLTRNPKNRPSAADALQDLWIANNYTAPLLKQNVLENLMTFQTSSRFRHAIMTMMAGMVASKQEKEELLAAFQALDLDGNGVLTVDELLAGYRKIYPQLSQEEVEYAVHTVVEKIDVNGSGQIDFTEFAVASMSQNSLLNKVTIQKAFKVFDTDGDGFIGRNELKAAMGGISLEDDEWDRLIEQFDPNQDGKVKFRFDLDFFGRIL